MARWKPGAEGRLTTAALSLFEHQGYDETTVAQIAEAAGLTKRTFFRYFADKREVLFDGSSTLQGRWTDEVRAAPSEASPMTAVRAGLDAVVELFADRHSLARVRSHIVVANAELQERELIKLRSLAEAVTAALRERGVPPNAAILAAQAGVTVFHVAFDRWVAQDDPTAFQRLVDESLQELRSVVAT